MPQLIAPPCSPDTVAPTGGGPQVVWRSWRIRPEWAGRGHATPLLTGVLGFPWQEAALDAKCLNQVRRPRGLEDRYHRVVPDPGCTCGIYASPAGLAASPDRGHRRHPTAAGFVALAGRVLATPTALRAQRAEIVGPLVVAPPVRPRRPGRRGAGPPQRVIVEPDRYRGSWTRGRAGVPYETWRAEVGEQLADRYGVEVIVGGETG